MVIIKHGSADRSDRLVRFECRECGCVFDMGPHERYENPKEYEGELRERGARYVCRCPCCNAECYA